MNIRRFNQVGIPVTEELLLKRGFSVEMVGKKKVDRVYKRGCISYFFYTYYKKLTSSYRIKGFYDFERKPELKYMHQIDYILFAYDGEELPNSYRNG